ncbi:VF530 family protein [Oceanospirillum sp. D5]|uniref:DUF2132 domain-containing protein n=1 Tax=Oceanospirillum sediminis TaxID=2760088 RepID=A0A839IV26_9GAMM|nr:DUF2132 domain-containing protein [Oceanospirillum sediminis]
MTESTQKPSDTTNRSDGRSDPLHGVKLEQILNELVEELGWRELAEQVPVNCFKSNPSVKSSLKFLRKTPWARQKVESLYLRMKGFSSNKRATKTPRALDAEQSRERHSEPRKSRNNQPRKSLSLPTKKRSTQGDSQGSRANPWQNARPGGHNKQDD